jgi:hypothetical protein
MSYFTDYAVGVITVTNGLPLVRDTVLIPENHT